MKPLRLLFVIDYLTTGGAQRQMVNLAVELRRRGHLVDFFCYHESTFYLDVLRDAQDTPRALLALVQPHQRAMLELPMSQLPVRAFFMLAGGLVVLLSVFLSFLVTSRISSTTDRGAFFTSM